MKDTFPNQNCIHRKLRTLDTEQCFIHKKVRTLDTGQCRISYNLQLNPDQKPIREVSVLYLAQNQIK